MDIKTKYRWALAGLFVMLAINAVTLVSIWTYSPPAVSEEESTLPSLFRHEKEEPLILERGRVLRLEELKSGNHIHILPLLKKELQLQPSQFDTILKLQYLHLNRVDSLRHELSQSRRVIFTLNLEDSSLGINQDSLLRATGNTYLNLEKALIRHMREMNTVLTPQQQREFRVLMSQSYLRNAMDDANLRIRHTRERAARRQHQQPVQEQSQNQNQK